MLRKFRVKINEKEYLVEMEEIGGNQVAHNPSPVQSQPQVQATPQPTSKPQVSSGSGEAINAPMPGTILDVRVNVGDHVSEDQVLVILEAMKMENEIVAPKAGVITEIAVSKNEAIDVGSLIVRIS